jgi:hypothetical protein
VPAYSKHLVLREFEPPGEEKDDGLFTVSEGIILIVKLVSGSFFPAAFRIFDGYQRLFVNPSLADIVEKGGDDDAIDGKLLHQLWTPDGNNVPELTGHLKACKE